MSLALPGLAALTCCLFACHRTESLSEYPPFIYSLYNEPIVLIGQVLKNPTFSGKIEPSRFDGLPVQFGQVEIKVENVLQGDVPPGSLTIFFFTTRNSISGSVLALANLPAGERDVFFLLKDSGKLRMACDEFKGCVPLVRTGPHPHFVRKPYSSTEDAVTEILLSRGEGATDEQMIKAMGTPISVNRSDGPYWKQLRILAATETPAVRAVASKILNSYDNPNQALQQ